MNEGRAREIVVMSMLAAGATIVIAGASKGELPRPRRLLALGMVYVALAALADTQPAVAAPLAGLVGVTVVLGQGADAATGVLGGVTRKDKLGTKDVPSASAPTPPTVAQPFGFPSAAGPPGARPAAGGSDGGARGIVERIVAIAQQAGGSGVGVVSSYRPGSTVGSGAPSDHSGNDASRAARDIAADGIDAFKGPPSPKLDAAAAAIGRAFGRPYGNGTGTIIDTFSYQGYRVQVIWRTPLYGGHMGHIHAGAHRG